MTASQISTRAVRLTLVQQTADSCVDLVAVTDGQHDDLDAVLHDPEDDAEVPCPPGPEAAKARLQHFAPARDPP
jgi:hypothetical protein